MNNHTSPAPLQACVDLLSDYLRKIDRNGLCSFEDSIRDCRGNEGDLIDTLFQTVWTRFEVDVLDESPRDLNVNPEIRDIAENLEDRANAFAVLERAEHFGTVAFAGEFMRLAPYILRNVEPRA
jgi:hypothetical protein